ncbi:MAG: serine hydrolase domain-containing protein [Bacteroidota bacterium]
MISLPMMRWSVCFLSLLLFCSCYRHSSLPLVQASAPPQMSQKMIQLAYQQVKNLPERTEFAIAVVEGPETRFLGLRKTALGVELIGNQQAVFEIGSITKVFTSHLMMEAIRRGVITDLDQPIQEVMECPMQEVAPITFRQLASHTGGLPRLPSNLILSLASAQNPYAAYSAKDLEKYLACKLQLTSPPGTAYQYSNLGAGLLGYLLSNLQEQSYEHLLHSQILTPLGMSSTTACRTHVSGRMVPPLNKAGVIGSHWDFQSLVGAGGIFSTSQDLAAYARFQIYAATHQLQEMTQPQFVVDRHNEVGLGWHRKLGTAGSPLLWHNGGTGGFRSCMALLPEQELAVVVLSNVSALHNPKQAEIDKLCFAWMDQLAEQRIASKRAK